MIPQLGPSTGTAMQRQAMVMATTGMGLVGIENTSLLLNHEREPRQEIWNDSIVVERVVRSTRHFLSEPVVDLVQNV
jgi:hypothetical protein